MRKYTKPCAQAHEQKKQSPGIVVKLSCNRFLIRPTSTKEMMVRMTSVKAVIGFMDGESADLNGRKSALPERPEKSGEQRCVILRNKGQQKVRRTLAKVPHSIQRQPRKPLQMSGKPVSNRRPSVWGN